MLFTFLHYPPILWLILCLFSVFPVFATPSFEQEYGWEYFEQAIDHWQAALDVDNLETSQQAKIMIQLASIYQAMGLYHQALPILLQAKTLAQSDALILAKLFTSLSDVSLATRKDTQARHYADKSVEILPPDAPALIRAIVLNNLANVLTVEAHYVKAIETYARCVELAVRTGDVILSGRALTNMAHTYFKNGQSLAATKILHAAMQQFQLLDNSYTKVVGLINVGELALLIPNSKNIADQALNTALKIAKEIDNPRLISYAYGFLGLLHGAHYEKALCLTQKAIFYATLELRFFEQKPILYRWQWQLGRLLKAQHQLDMAIKAYQEAIESLQPLELELTTDYRKISQSFRERVGPIYFELADLLLQRAAKMGALGDLKKALSTIERFKVAELQIYYQDKSVTQFGPITLDLSGVVYPIILPDRTEILLGLPNGIQQFTIPITASQLKDDINEFRFELEAHDTSDFLPYAQRLYRWLIAPLSSSLKAQGVDTLIIVPDGLLRTIPFASLHDGQQFLISKYAIVTMPRLSLTEFIHRVEAKILMTGLKVRDEFEGIGTQLLNQDFTINNFINALKKDNYSILHIASQGQFESESQQTFFLTYDGKLNINQLVPVDLLTLGASQTRIGDDQAALGLTSVALKVGAKNALASLWVIDDQATSLLMKMFYQELQKKEPSKALQAAQLYLLEYSRYEHPAFWAPFLLLAP